MADANKKDMIAWVKFESGTASLRRIVTPGGKAGLFIQTSRAASGLDVFDRAVKFGFTPLKSGDSARMIFKDGAIPFSARALANGLGGEVFGITRDELRSDAWTINLSTRAPVKNDEPETNTGNEVASTAPAAPIIKPDKETVSIIGMNLRGEEVIRDKSGRFFRQVDRDTGQFDFIPESPEERGALFLRARSVEDLAGIATGLINMGIKGTLHVADFDRVVDAAIEPAPFEGTPINMSREDVASRLRAEMIQIVTAHALQDKSSREMFNGALRIASSINYVVGQASETDGMLNPSLAVATFMRRQMRGIRAIDARISPAFASTLPKVGEEGTATDAQIHDLGALPQDSIAAYAMNVVSRRDATGRSLIIAPGAAGDDMVEMLRSEIGRSYALEIVAEMSAQVADGFTDAQPRTFIFVGDRRPEALEALPQAANRTFKVQTPDDLVNLEAEIRRSRSQIKAFHDGIEAVEEDTDARVENQRQRPYQPLSKAGEGYTMIPLALEGATMAVLDRMRRDLEGRGGVDSYVGTALGMDFETLKATLLPEQIDSIGMRMWQNEKGRGYLCADMTGIGKGRNLAACAKAHLRADPRNKVLYFTESAIINVPDVCRDMQAVGALEDNNVSFLTAGSEYIRKTKDPVTGLEMSVTMKSLKPRERKEIFAAQRWPDETDVIITNYTQFNGAEGSAQSNWIRNAVDEHTMIIMDEAHNALNKKSNTGRNIREAMEIVGKGNVLFGTATPSRDPSGMDLYRPMLPNVEKGRLDEMLSNMKDGGEIAQEAFATMLAADGCMIRRDHDLSRIKYMVALPTDAQVLKYQGIMNKFSPLVEMLIEQSTQIAEHVGQRQARDYAAALDRGMNPQQARAAGNQMNQYSTSLGSPLANLARITMNAIKIDQVVDEAIQEINEGRKPLLTFHSTNEALLTEKSKGLDGKKSEEAMANATGLSLRDQIRRTHNSMYSITHEGERVDARDLYADVRETSALIEAAIMEIPLDLPVSPVDALIERLEANDIRVGEISGRKLCYRGGRIEVRGNRNRKATIDGFNNGDIDVLLYNAAGATGGSYHSDPKFKDSRPRTLVEMEAPTDIIKYVQGQGRGNRFGQVHEPRVKSVMTGLTPEMRILQQRNKKLRSLGASVDGNRSHPLLLDDVPDLLNKVGDEATRNVLRSMPSLTRRLGFPEYASDDEVVDVRAVDENDTGSGAVGSGAESLANKILARSIMLPAKEQEDFVQRIILEFDSLIEELDSRNANPLRPKQLRGRLEIKATDIFSGVENEVDEEVSAFLSPLYVSTAIHHFDEEAYDGEALMMAVDKSKRLFGSEGLKPWSERIKQNMPSLMRHHLPEGLTIEEALEEPGRAGARFVNAHNKLGNLAWLLENMQPGVSMSSRGTLGAMIFGSTIVNVVPPKNPAHFTMPAAYKVEMLTPGDPQPQKISLSRIMTWDMDDIRFKVGVSEGPDPAFLQDFDEQSKKTLKLPVQILHGNILEALTVSAQNNLGSVSLYTDMDGHVHRGIVIDKDKVDLTKLPTPIPSGRIAAEIFHKLQTMYSQSIKLPDGKSLPKVVKFWGNMSQKADLGKPDTADLEITLTNATARFDFVPYRKTSRDWYLNRPGLYEALHKAPPPSVGNIGRTGARGGRGTHAGQVEVSLATPEGREQVYDILSHLDDAYMMTRGYLRPIVNDTTNDIERIMNTRRPDEDAVAAAEAAAADQIEDAEVAGTEVEAEAEVENAPFDEDFMDVENVDWS